MSCVPFKHALVVSIDLFCARRIELCVQRQLYVAKSLSRSSYFACHLVIYTAFFCQPLHVFWFFSQSILPAVLAMSCGLVSSHSVLFLFVFSWTSHRSALASIICFCTWRLVMSCTLLRLMPHSSACLSWSSPRWTRQNLADSAAFQKWRLVPTCVSVWWALVSEFLLCNLLCCADYAFGDLGVKHLVLMYVIVSWTFLLECLWESLDSDSKPFFLGAFAKFVNKFLTLVSMFDDKLSWWIQNVSIDDAAEQLIFITINL